MKSSVLKFEKRPNQRWNSDTSLVFQGTNNSDKKICRNLRLSELSRDNSDNSIFIDPKPAAVSCNILPQSHSSLLSNQVEEHNANLSDFLKTNQNDRKIVFLNAINTELIQKRHSLSVFTYDFGSSQQSVFSETFPPPNRHYFNKQNQNNKLQNPKTFVTIY